MRQATLKIKMYAENVSVADNMGRTLLYGMLCFTAGLAVLYLIFLSNMVFNIVERRSLEAEARTLTSQVGDMELTYLSLSSSLDMNLAHSMSFQATKPNFATRPSLGLGSKGNSNEI